MVPTEVYKAVYDPKLGQAGAYIAENADDAKLREVSVAQLRQESGIDVFPGLPEAVKARAMDLPDPTGPSRREPTSASAPVGADKVGCGLVRWFLSGLRCQ